MGRPSLADVRRPQLLDAYAACLVRYGVEGTTLDRVAQEAGVTRGLVRHYLGNREEVLRALGERARDAYLAWFDAAAEAPDRDPTEALLDALFRQQPEDLYAVLDALFVEAPKDPHIAALLRGIYQAFFGWVDARLAVALPEADPAARKQVALALVSFGFAETDFEAIGFRPSRRREYRAVGARLIDSLR